MRRGVVADGREITVGKERLSSGDPVDDQQLDPETIEVLAERGAVILDKPKRRAKVSDEYQSASGD